MATKSTLDWAKRQAADETLPLTPLEALHMEVALSSCLEKLALIGVINVDPAAQAQELTQSVGDEIGRMISEQQRLEGRFEELVAEQRELRGHPNVKKLQDNEAQLVAVSSALRSATQQLCRNLKDNLSVADNMAKISHQRAALVALLTSTLRSLRGAGGGVAEPSVLPVVEAVIAAEKEEADAREVVEAEQAAAVAVRQLRQALQDEKAAHEEAVREGRRVLAALKEQLRGDKLRLAVERRYHEKDLAASNQHARRLQRTKLAASSDELALLRQRVDIERAAAAAAGEHQARAAAARQDDAAGWAARREEDARAKERALEVVRAQHQRDALRLKDLEQRLAEEQELKAASDEKKREEAEAAEREAAAAVGRLRAAVRIQAAWRGYKARREVRPGGTGAGERASAKR